LYRGCPLRAEALEYFRLLFDVDLYREIVGIDKILNSRVRVNLGIQPGAGSSHWCCIEIDQQRALAGSSFLERSIDIIFPCY
jgi:hypothetical protein